MSARRPNLLFVVLDTVRADNLSLYGYERETTPFLDRFAGRSITYEHAYAPAPWTTPSHASMFTGTSTNAHQTCRENERITPDLPVLAELLSEAGYETVGFSNNAHVSPDFEFDRGFDTFVFNGESYNEPFDGGVSVSRIRSYKGDGPLYQQLAEALRYVRQKDGSLNRTVLNWLYRKASEAGLISNQDRGAQSTNQFVQRYLNGREDDRPFFMYLNYMEAHAPYQSPAEYQYRYVDEPLVSGWGSQGDYFAGRVSDQERKVGDLRDQYDGCIRYLDTMVEELIETVEGHSDDTLVVIASDHGEAFGEHGLYEHKAGLYDELVRVPLLVNPPGSETDVVDVPVSCRWLFSTFLEAAGAPVPEHAENVDLTEPTERPVLLESEGLPYDEPVYDSPLPRKFGSAHQGYITGDRKLVRYEHDDTKELYEITDESRDAAPDRPETVATMCEQLEETLAANERPVRSDATRSHEITPETREHLRTLGYR